MPELGWDVAARPGMAEAEVVTPALILDMGALERNVTRMGALVREAGIRHRSHGKMHKSVDVQRLQERLGGAVGVCCQAVSEAEAFARGGIADILVTNEVRQPVLLDRLARLPARGARVAVCVDAADGVAALSEAATWHGATLGAYVEIDVGQGRCGVATVPEAVALARAVHDAPGLRLDGIQAYHGGAQHRARDARAEAASRAADTARAARAALAGAGLPCPVVTGGGTGTWRQDAASGAYDEVQAGSYAFMDADYGRVEGLEPWENALFVLASVVSTGPGRAVLDAGLKSMSGESGPPRPAGRDLAVTALSDEHTQLADPGGTLRAGDRLRLIPGHCDPTVNLHDHYVCLRDGLVEALWPVTARGRSW